MKLGLSMWSYVRPWKRGEMEATDFISKAKTLGVDGVELLDFFFRNQEDWRPETQSILRARDEAELPIGVFSVANMFGDPDPQKIEEQVAVIRRGVDQASALGADVVRVFSGSTLEGQAIDEMISVTVDGLARACDYAAQRNVKLALENHGHTIGRGDQVAHLIEMVRAKTGDKTLGANPDTGNFMLCGNTSSEGTRAVADYAYMCHFKDFARLTDGNDAHSYAAIDGTRYMGTAIGEGEADLAGAVAALKHVSFDGWFNIEYEADEDAETGVPRSVSNARRFLR